MKLRAHKLRGTEAAEIAEAALVLPVVFVFLLGIIWFGRAFNIYSTITQAAQQGAILAARPSCAICLPPGGSWSGTNFPGDPAVVNTVTAVMQASSLNDPIPVNTKPPTALSCVDFSVLTCPPAGNINICRQALLNPPVSPNQTPLCGTIVSFQYPVPFYVPFTSLTAGSFTVSAQAQSRMEN